MSVSQTKLIEISEQSLNWIFQKGMRFILILFQQFKYRPFLGWTWLKPSNRISKEIYRQSMAGFSPIPMELYQNSEALIQPILFNLERKKRGLKARVLRSQPKLRIAFMVLLRQFRRPQCSCSVWFVTPRSGSAFERTSPQVAPCRNCQRWNLTEKRQGTYSHRLALNFPFDRKQYRLSVVSRRPLRAVMGLTLN